MTPNPSPSRKEGCTCKYERSSSAYAMVAKGYIINSDGCPIHDKKGELTMKPHEERVVTEQAELLEKLNKLREFIDGNPLFQKLDYDEQGRLKIQRFIMEQYSAVLLDRIDNFPV